jgi:hypothetical protein
MFADLMMWRVYVLHYARNEPRSTHSFFKVKFKSQHDTPFHVQSDGTGIDLPIYNLGASLGWVFNIKPRPLCHQERNPVAIVQRAGWAPGPVLTGVEKRKSHIHWGSNCETSIP